MRWEIPIIILCVGLGFAMIHIGVVFSWILILPGMGLGGYAGWLVADLIRRS